MVVKYAWGSKLELITGRNDTECTWECAFIIMITIVDFGNGRGICFGDMSVGIAGQILPQICDLLMFKAK